MVFQEIFLIPGGIFKPAAVQLDIDVWKIQANTAFTQCLLWPQIAASVTVAMPFRKKKAPIRKRPSPVSMGYRAYMWNRAIRMKAPRTPSERATTTGTPIFGRPYLKGAYARDVQGEAKALCHVSDLSTMSTTIQASVRETPTRIQSNCPPDIKARKGLD